jgi:hypothetical protein
MKPAFAKKLTSSSAVEEETHGRVLQGDPMADPPPLVLSFANHPPFPLPAKLPATLQTIHFFEYKQAKTAGAIRSPVKVTLN